MDARPRIVTGRVGLALGAALVLAAAAGSCTTEAVSPRRGHAGESCLRTDDCVEPLLCIANVCGGEAHGGGGAGGAGGGAAGHGGQAGHGGEGGQGAVGGGGGGPGGVGGGGSGSGNAGGGGFGGAPPCDGVGSNLSLGVCDACLDSDCHAELCACGDACIAVEACLETVCRGLQDLTQEGLCQVYCQNAHPGGKDPHLAVVNCAYTGNCIPPCQGYPTDWDSCRAQMIAGDCAAAWSACQGSVQCQVYEACTSGCATSAACIACGATIDGATGKLLLEAFEACVARECIAESWAY